MRAAARRSRRARDELLYPAAWRVGAVLLGAAILLALGSSVASGWRVAADSAQMVAGFSVAAAQDGLDGWDASSSWLGEYSSELPEGFAAEGFVPQDAELLASDDGATVGFFVAGDAAAVQAVVEDGLCSRGWVVVESGSDAVRTYIKDAGRFRWLAVTCSGAPGGTSVVMTMREVVPDGL